MTSRRNFLKTAGAVTAGVAAAATASTVTAAAGHHAGGGGYEGPHEMPTKLTLLSMKNSDGTETLGVKTAEGIVDVRKASKMLRIRAPHTLEQLLREGSASQVHKLVASVQSSAKAKSAIVDESTITHGRLFTNPGKIVCIGLNYRAHAAEAGEKVPSVPILFNKYNNALAAHNCTIKLPPREVSYKFDYETEMLIVIGKPARNVSEADALNYVAGYCTAQDFLRARPAAGDPGRSMDGRQDAGQFRPDRSAFRVADLVGDASNLKIETYVNGEVRQSTNTGMMIFNPQKLIAYISKMWTLEPGDIIWSGTPAGCIIGLPKDKQVWLKAGDEIRSSIEKLGDLKFKLA